MDLGLKLNLPRTAAGQIIFPDSAELVAVSFALKQCKVEDVLRFCGVSGFDPNTRTWKDLSEEERKRFQDNSPHYNAIFTFFKETSIKFWNNYDHRGKMKSLEPKVL